MIKISIDTENEISIVRRVLKDFVCSHCSCDDENHSCSMCVEEYLEGKVQLFQREIVEEQIRIMV